MPLNDLSRRDFIRSMTAAGVALAMTLDWA